MTKRSATLKTEKGTVHVTESTHGEFHQGSLYMSSNLWHARLGLEECVSDNLFTPSKLSNRIVDNYIDDAAELRRIASEDVDVDEILKGLEGKDFPKGRKLTLQDGEDIDFLDEAIKAYREKHPKK